MHQILKRTFSHSLEQSRPTRSGDHVVSVSASNKRASAVGQCPLLGTGSWLPLPVSSVAFAALHDALGVLTPICGDERPTSSCDLAELAAFPADVAFVALMRLYLRTRHGLVPEEKEQNDDQVGTPAPKCTSSHGCLRCSS